MIWSPYLTFLPTGQSTYELGRWICNALLCGAMHLRITHSLTYVIYIKWGVKTMFQLIRFDPRTWPFRRPVNPPTNLVVGLTTHHCAAQCTSESPTHSHTWIISSQLWKQCLNSYGLIYRTWPFCGPVDPPTNLVGGFATHQCAAQCTSESPTQSHKWFISCELWKQCSNLYDLIPIHDLFANRSIHLPTW